jgi:hypothetical protein
VLTGFGLQSQTSGHLEADVRPNQTHTARIHAQVLCKAWQVPAERPTQQQDKCRCNVSRLPMGPQ